MEDYRIYSGTKKWKNKISEYISYSNRIAVLKFRISKTQTLSVIQVYAPTLSHPDDEVEQFNDLLIKSCDEYRRTFNIVMGDFSAEIGQ